MTQDELKAIISDHAKLQEYWNDIINAISNDELEIAHEPNDKLSIIAAGIGAAFGANDNPEAAEFLKHVISRVYVMGYRDATTIPDVFRDEI